MELQKKIAAAFWSERDRLVLWTPVLLAIGIGSYFALPTEPPLWLGFAAFLVATAAVFFTRRLWGWRSLALAWLLMAVGFSVANLHTWWVDAPALYSTLYFRDVQGKVDLIEERGEGRRLTLSEVSISRIRPETTPRRIAITLKQMPESVQVGDMISTKALLFPPPTPAMPGAYDFSRQYYFGQIGAVGYSPKPPIIIKHADSLGFESWLTDMRLALAERIKRHMSAESGPVAAALMVGEMSSVSDEVRDAMRDSGIYHVLSISGLHMSIAIGLLYISLRFALTLYPCFALRWPVKKIAATAGLIGGLIYLLLAGYPVPAVRSYVMVACVMLAILCDRQGISVYSLAWAATIILLLQPEALLGSSFQLSFAATLAIVAFYERYAHLLRSDGRGIFYKLRLYFFGLMATSLVASLATTPLVIYHFNRFTLWGIAANMLMMPLASFIIMPAALLAFLLMPLGLEAPALYVLDWGIALMIDGARWFAAMPYASVSLPSLTFSGLIVFCIGGLWLCLMAGRWRYAGAAVMALGISSVMLHTPYDLLISDDAKKVALIQPDGQFHFIKGKSGFDGDMWMRSHGQEEQLAALNPAAKACEEGWCYSEGYGRRIAVTYGKKQLLTPCEVKADIIITDRYQNEPCKSGVLVIDRKFLYRNGATALRFMPGGGVELTTAEAGRRGRPWSSEAQYQKYHSVKAGSASHSELYDSTQAAITEE